MKILTSYLNAPELDPQPFKNILLLRTLELEPRKKTNLFDNPFTEDVPSRFVHNVLDIVFPATCIAEKQPLNRLPDIITFPRHLVGAWTKVKPFALC